MLRYRDRFSFRPAFRVLVLGAVLLGLLLYWWLRSGSTDSEEANFSQEVWSYIQSEASKRKIDPGFVYALAWAESSLNPRAQSSVSKGIMQLTEAAWTEVSDEPYSRAWEWKVNINVGIDYLSFCRDFLERHDRFTYPLLAAAYRYGPYYVRSRGFEIDLMKKQTNRIYRSIFSGNIRPVPPP